MCRRRHSHRTPARLLSQPNTSQKLAQAAALMQIGAGGCSLVAALACRLDSCFADFLAVGAWTGAFQAACGLLSLAGTRWRGGRRCFGEGGSCHSALTGVLGMLAALLAVMAIGVSSVGLALEADLRRYAAVAAQGGGLDGGDAHLAERCDGVDRRTALLALGLCAQALQVPAGCTLSALALLRRNGGNHIISGNSSVGCNAVEDADLADGAEAERLLAAGGCEWIPMGERAVVLENSAAMASAVCSCSPDVRRTVAAAAAAAIRSHHPPATMCVTLASCQVSPPQQML